MSSRFQSNTKTPVAFINAYDVNGQPILDETVLSTLADRIERGEVRVECYLNKDGKPTLMIRL